MTSPANTTDRRELTLAVGGMSCASCAARVEKRLNQVDGVVATVNFATEQATVGFPSSVTPQDLVSAIEETGYTATLPARIDGPAAPEDSDATTTWRRRLLVSATLAVPVVLLSMVPALQFDYWQWLALALTTPVAVWGAWPFHRAALANLRHRAATMDTLVSVGVAAAYLWSLWALLFTDAGMPGMKMTMRLLPNNDWRDAPLSRGRRRGHRLHPGRALFRGARETAVRCGAARPDRHGRQGRLPCCGTAQPKPVFRSANSRWATSSSRGPARRSPPTASWSRARRRWTRRCSPASPCPSKWVPATVSSARPSMWVADWRSGPQASAPTPNSRRWRGLVTAAQSGKAEVQRLADRVAAVFVPIVIGLALLTLAGWLLLGASAATAFTAAVAVLIIACPCALGLATPTALLVGTGRGAQMGILIKGPQVLESTRRIDTVVLDKTGTVTTGRMSVTSVHATGDTSSAEILRLAGALEHASEHPIGRAIAAHAAEAGALAPVTSFENHGGSGVTGVVDNRALAAGRHSWLRETWALEAPAELRDAAEKAEADGKTAVWIAVDGEIRAVIVVSDTIKESSRAAVDELRGLGLSPVLLTGDNRRAASAVARQLGIDEVFAEVLPAEKVEHIKRLQNEGKVVAMVGDGVNDAAALAQADLGLALGTGTDVAIAASDLTLVRGDLRAAPDAIRLSRATLRTIKGNLFWAFAYNVAALPLAALGLLNPLIAGAAMAFSSVFVVSNSLRLRRFTPSR